MPHLMDMLLRGLRHRKCAPQCKSSDQLNQ
jgi:hypothetical protein